MAQRIEQHAVTVERDLVVAARAAKPQRRATLAGPAEEIRRIEQNVLLLSQVSQQWRTTMATGSSAADAHPLLDVEDQLAAAGWAVTAVDAPPPVPQPRPEGTPRGTTFPAS